MSSATTHEPAADLLPETDSSRSRWPVLIAAAVFACLSLVCAVRSEGFIAADSCLHYLLSRFAFSQPAVLVDVWGRPFCTALYSLPGQIGNLQEGRLAVRVTSMLLALSCAAVAMRIARAQAMRWPLLAFIFTLASPLVFLHSFSEMTELPFAALIGFAFSAYQARRFGVMALLVGLSPLARPEGFGFVLLAAIALLLHRKPWWPPILAMPLVGWSLAGWHVYGRHGPWWRWLPEHWPYAANSAYPAGSLWTFVRLLPLVVGPFVLPATLIGIFLTLDEGVRRRPTRRNTHDEDSASRHLARCRLLIALLPLMVLSVHSLLHWLGKLGSYGEPRYLIVTAPFWGLLSARGWEWVFDRLHWKRPLPWATIAALLPLLANFIVPILPLRMPDHWRAAKWVASEFSTELEHHGYPYIISSHPGVFYFLGISPTEGTRTLEWSRETIEKCPPGAMLVWDPVYSFRNSDAARVIPADDISKYGWEENRAMERELEKINSQPQPWPTVDRSTDLDARGPWRVFLSPRISDKQASR